MYTPLPLAIQTSYQDLLDRHRRRPAVSIEGSLISETRGNQLYWVARKRVGHRVHATQVGPDSPETRLRVETARAEQARLDAWRREASSLVAQLRAAGANTLDMKTGRVIAALARIGFFRSGGVLAGTHAFAMYELELGVRFGGVVTRTEDVDLMADSSVRLSGEGSSISGLLDDLGLEAIVSVGEPHPVRWTTSDGTPIDFLTPRRRGGKSVVALKELGLHGQALPYLDFVIAGAIDAVGLYREGALVRVPAPERYAVHKLIVAAERQGSFRAKSAKDIEQATVLAEVLAEQRPFELRSAYHEARESGPKWRKALTRSLERTPVVADILSRL